MENVEALMGALFNAALVIFIMAAMFAAGLSTTLSALGKVFKNIWLLVLVLLAAIVVRPLVGWGTAELLSLETPAYVAMLLLAACAGAPFGAKMVMTARGNVVTGASLQVLLAVIGTFTFPIIANFMISAAGLGEDFSLPVADLIKTVAFLQLLPFALGIAVRHWTPETAEKWNPPVTQVSNYALLIVVALALLGNWRTMIESLGTFTLLSGTIFTVVMLIVGWFMTVGDRSTRIATSLIEPVSNTGPVFAAVAIGFNNDPQILSATVMILVVQTFGAVFAASYLGKGQPAPEEASAATTEAK
jgi:BASS family bile acid:Na+ symporter